MTANALKDAGKAVEGSRVLLMGLTYKEDVPDTRGSPLEGVIGGLREFGVEIYGYDPLVDDVEARFGIKAIPSIADSPPVDAVIIAVAHKVFRDIPLSELRAKVSDKPVLVDVRGLYSGKEAEEAGFH